MTFIHDLTLGSRLSTSDILLLSGYVVICIGIGFWASRCQKDKDFMIAGRRLNFMRFITGIGFTIIPAGIASFHWILSNRATMASLIN